MDNLKLARSDEALPLIILKMFDATTNRQAVEEHKKWSFSYIYHQHDYIVAVAEQ